ncbi:VanZ family protein [Lachnoclostridium sp. An138]|uniref:VanZ family protein n=1 Tax=Lachnoclostridium sp. An138 TaxID=1965560 RepID=UPI003FA53A19
MFLIVIFSFGLELFQIVIIAVFHSITLYFDIKDLLLNLIGGLAGYGLFAAWR